jgi:phosphoglycerate kinase
MPAKAIADMDVQGRRVFIRVDFDVPLTPAGGVSDASRIRESLPTIQLAIDRGARVVLGAHLGRPKGKPNLALSLMPVAACLVELIDRDVVLADEPTGDGAKKVVADLRDGSVAMLENLRFAPGEESNDEAFSRVLASYADVYINDAFSAAHLAHASIAGMSRFVSSKGMGLQVEREVKILSKLTGEVEGPFVAIIGGTRLVDKMGVLENLLDRADAILIGGAIANTFLKARGGRLGISAVEGDRLAWARAFLLKAEQTQVDVLLPVDLVAASDLDAAEGQTVSAMKVPDQLAALDIGPETIQRFAEGLSHARTLFWHGPMGACEAGSYAVGTIAVAQAVAAVKFGLTVVAGRDSAAALRRAGAADRVTHLSTGGFAALEFIAGKKLPGLAALES